MSQLVLVCFAVSQEAKPFQKLVRRRQDVRVVVTGMGAARAERAIRQALAELRPARVFTCGFAGALHPDLQIADVICPCETAVAGARPVQFYFADRVAVTVAEKSALRARTSADAVEMESGAIASVCRAAGIPCVTLRAVSDTAREDLPLDFNRLMTLDHELSTARLAWALIRSPQRIPALWRLGRNSGRAARRLADVLVKVI
jgi:adenosylhomocysteine nucleosidase